MHLRIFFGFVLSSLLFFNFLIYGQVSVPSASKPNLQCFSELIGRNYSEFENAFAIKNADKIYQINFMKNDETSAFFYRLFREKFGNRKIITEDKNIKPDILVNFSDLTLSTEYQFIKKNIFLSKKLKRVLNYSCSYEFSDSAVFYKSKISDVYTDTVNYEDAASLGQSESGFTYGKIPEETLIEKIFIPASAVILSAVTVVLFFILRSK